MSENILVAVAWPYANSDIHVGNITGSTCRPISLPATSACPATGCSWSPAPTRTARRSPCAPTPKSSTPAATSTSAITAASSSCSRSCGLTYDLFTSTHTENHFKVSQDIFLALQQNGYLYTERQKQWYRPTQGRFLPDRYVEGTCYICGYPNARGDQCDNCGNLLDATQLIDPRSKIDGSTPELRETEHFYLDLGKLQPGIVEFLRQREELLAAERAAPVARADPGRRACTAAPSPATWIGASPCRSRAGRASACTSGSRPSSATSRPPSSGRRLNGQPEAWHDWWYKPEAPHLLLHRQGQHPLPRRHLAGQLIGAASAFGELFEGDRGSR